MSFAYILVVMPRLQLCCWFVGSLSSYWGKLLLLQCLPQLPCRPSPAYDNCARASRPSLCADGMTGSQGAVAVFKRQATPKDMVLSSTSALYIKDPAPRTCLTGIRLAGAAAAILALLASALLLALRRQWPAAAAVPLATAAQAVVKTGPTATVLETATAAAPAAPAAAPAAPQAAAAAPAGSSSCSSYSSGMCAATLASGAATASHAATMASASGCSNVGAAAAAPASAEPCSGGSSSCAAAPPAALAEVDPASTSCVAAATVIPAKSQSGDSSDLGTDMDEGSASLLSVLELTDHSGLTSSDLEPQQEAPFTLESLPPNLRQWVVDPSTFHFLLRADGTPQELGAGAW